MVFTSSVNSFDEQPHLDPPLRGEGVFYFYPFPFKNKTLCHEQR